MGVSVSSGNGDSLKNLFVLIHRKLKSKGTISVSSPVHNYFIISWDNFSLTFYPEEYLVSGDRMGYNLWISENGKEIYKRYIPVIEYQELGRLFSVCREIVEQKPTGKLSANDMGDDVIERVARTLA